MDRIYVAGAMTDRNPLKFLANLSRGIRASVQLILKGYAPFSPFIDFQYFLNLREGEEITSERIKEISMRWLEVSDAVAVLPHSEQSQGTQAEIARAKELGIPVYSLEELL